MLAEQNEDVRECVVEIKELSADERMRMQCEAREDYYRRLSGAKKYGIELGINIGKAQNLVSNVENAMKNLNLTLEQACSALCTTIEDYEKAQKACEENKSLEK